ncbi:class I SAM-dependent methyltransferase [Bradyrhizobium arachidis]|uniref:Methyltransferase domain-containing protein n=1 Tax=Bradyrhizobium arachidis TaxID=858423 RepID=A0AAE7NM52_9BRAD|nr:class I SAM-dependent methyltransferase [Bradyrhizobium arachidis]QOZ66695.1 methyltransferase domain-containing protein [Bradyrhizobium arachidis]SFV14859.1 Methyltransferase domain-containing protein [Bradyrhizobium arachidis]
MLASSIFEGAAFYYARYQPEYPHELFKSLSDHLSLTPESRVLDLGCGTGQIGIGLAPSVKHVDCVDPNRAMLGEADRLSSERGLLNISVIESTAEEMDWGLTGYQGATIASAFHWMDRSLVLETLDRRLLSSGKVAIITRVRDETAPNDWWNRIWEFVHTWWGGYFPAGRGDKRRELRLDHEAVLRQSTFSNITGSHIPYMVSWTSENLVQYMYSTSKACPGVLTQRRDEFDEQMRSLLHQLSPADTFVERCHLYILYAGRY